MPQAILILGASARAAAGSAVRAGYEPWAADLFGDADLACCRLSRRVADYPAGLVRTASDFPPAPWMYTGALENHPRLVDRIADQRPLYGNPGAVLRGVRDPVAVNDALRAAGLPCPDVTRLRSGCDEGTWLRKPLASCGGDRITRVEGRTADGDRPRRVFFQRFVAGQPCSAVFVAASGQAVLLGVTRQLTGATWAGADGFRYSGSLGPLPLDGRLEAAFRAIGQCLATRFGLAGLFGVDAILAEDSVWPVEVNPRYTASVEILERGLGLRAVADHIRACQVGALPAAPRGPSTGRCGKIVVYARQPCRVPADFADFVAQANRGAPWPTVADVPVPGTCIQVGHPVVTVLATGLSLAAVEQRLRALVVEVQQRLGC
jgi:predicted ATP-grasp superfamily ATP-dependent carboligase